MRKQNILIFVLVLVWLAGCAEQKPNSSLSVQFEAKVPKELMSRFVSYWEARNRKDWKRALEFERPSWRKLYRPKRYRIYLSIVNKVPLTDLVIQKARCKERRCCFLLEGVFQTSKGKKNWRWDDCWVKEGGKWYHVIEDPLFFPPSRGKAK